MSHLSSDYTKEGHLHKTGPSPNDVYKKRWCTLGGRKLMYHVEPLDAYPKVLLGGRDGISVQCNTSGRNISGSHRVWILGSAGLRTRI